MLWTEAYPMVTYVRIRGFSMFYKHENDGYKQTLVGIRQKTLEDFDYPQISIL